MCSTSLLPADFFPDARSLRISRTRAQACRRQTPLPLGGRAGRPNQVVSGLNAEWSQRSLRGAKRSVHSRCGLPSKSQNSSQPFIFSRDRSVLASLHGVSVQCTQLVYLHIASPTSRGTRKLRPEDSVPPPPITAKPRQRQQQLDFRSNWHKERAAAMAFCEIESEFDFGPVGNDDCCELHTLLPRATF